MSITTTQIKELARVCGFELAGITPALPLGDYSRFDEWRRSGKAGDMSYLTDRRGDLRSDPRHLLPEAQSIVCVAKLYNTESPRSTTVADPERGWISRYAWGADYHDLLRERLTELVGRIRDVHGQPFHWKICVDTAPLLERSYARAAGLGWIGKNTCLINQASGSWFFLGELLLSIPLQPDSPPPDRCGTCSRCIDACPTAAIVPSPQGRWEIDSSRCISYLTIEKRGHLPQEILGGIGNHLFGCDICQDVCPWNAKSPASSDDGFGPTTFFPRLGDLAGLTEDRFRELFRRSPVWRTKYEGFLRNVAVAMGNSGRPEMRAPLETLARHQNQVVAQTAERALAILTQTVGPL